MNHKNLLESGEAAYFENARLKHFKNQVTSERYFANYLSYKTMPDLTEFQSDLAYLANEQKDYKSNYAFIFFAETAELDDNIKAYLSDQGFELEKHIIFTNLLDNLSLRKRDLGDIRIAQLTEETLPAYVEYKYQQSLPYGKEYADQMKLDNERHMLTNGSKVFLAMDKNNIIGDVTAWFYGDYVEIDDFAVDENYRGKGIGSALQLTASKGYEKVILIAEEENRDMYQHQGYKEVSYYWTALKS